MTACHINVYTQEKNNRFPMLDILGYLKNTPKNPKFGKVRQVPTREFSTKFPGWDLSHSSTLPFLWVFFNPFAPRDFAEKHVLKLVEWFSGHCRAIKS